MRDYLEWLGALLAIGGTLLLFQLFALSMTVDKMKDKASYQMRDKSR